MSACCIRGPSLDLRLACPSWDEKHVAQSFLMGTRNSSACVYDQSARCYWKCVSREANCFWLSPLNAQEATGAPGPKGGCLKDEWE